MTTLRRPAKVLAAIGLATATAAASLAAGSVPGGAQVADPQVTLDPATDLVDGSRVTVTATGFRPNGDLEIMQCAAGNSGFAGCDFSDVQGLTADAAGSATLEFAVDATIPNSEFGTSEQDCRPAGACVMRVFGNFDDPSAAEVAEAPLVFDPDAPLAPPPTVTVDPSDGLTDGQSVTVTADGLVWSDDAIAI
jgi:Neocarzinostatin family